MKAQELGAVVASLLVCGGLRAETATNECLSSVFGETGGLTERGTGKATRSWREASARRRLLHFYVFSPLLEER